MGLDLVQQHQGIRDMCRDLRPILAQPSPPDLAMLASLRWKIVTSILQQLPAKDRLLFAPLYDHSDPAIAARARAHRTALDDLFARYISHFEAWPDERIKTQWRDYRSPMWALFSELLDRLDTEENELLPFVDEGPGTPSLRRVSTRNWAAEAIRRKQERG